MILVWKNFSCLANSRESEEMGGSSYKEELPTAKTDFKGSGGESGGKHIPVPLRAGVGSFCLG